MRSEHTNREVDGPTIVDVAAVAVVVETFGVAAVERVYEKQ